MSMEKNIFKIVNNVINIIQKDPYYFTEINDYNLEYKDIDQLWDYFKSTSDDYHDKFKSQEEIIISDELKEGFKNGKRYNKIRGLSIEFKDKIDIEYAKTLIPIKLMK